MTIKTGLLGSPLNKSLSPRLFRIFSGATGVEYAYTLLETRGPGIAQALEKVINRGWAGFNVTLPLKEKIIPFLNSLSPEACAIGAVNAVRIKNGKLKGYNTDAGATGLALKEAGGRLRGRTCVIWGAGGAAGAAAWTLGFSGAKTVDIHNRSFSRAAGLVKYFSRLYPRTVFTARRFTDHPSKEATLFINATPLGMYARRAVSRSKKAPGKPLPANLLFSGPAGSFYLDFAYARGLTPFLKNRAGVLIPGLDILTYQALKSSEIFGGRRIKAAEIVKLKDRVISTIVRQCDSKTER